MTVTTQTGGTLRGTEAIARDGIATSAGSSGRSHSVFIDLDTVLLSMHRGKRGIEVGVQADLSDGLNRLSVIADRIVVLAYPPTEQTRKITARSRLETLHAALGDDADGLLVVSCEHGSGECDCSKPGRGLINLAIQKHELSGRGGWYIGTDQEGVVSGRSAGLSTIRIGPEGRDHLSNVHRPDYEARDLLDAANHILLAELS
jgi:hypothetical protein